MIELEGEPTKVGRRTSSVDFDGDERKIAVIRQERALESTLERNATRSCGADARERAGLPLPGDADRPLGTTDVGLVGDAD